MRLNWHAWIEIKTDNISPMIIKNWMKLVKRIGNEGLQSLRSNGNCDRDGGEGEKQIDWKYENVPCSCLVLSTVWQAIRHSCSSGEGIKPAEPPTASRRACHQWWSSLLIIYTEMGWKARNQLNKQNIKPLSKVIDGMAFNRPPPHL